MSPLAPTDRSADADRDTDVGIVHVGSDADDQGFSAPSFRTAVRASPLLLAAAYALNGPAFDDALASTWASIYNWAPAHQPLFEAEVASLGFFLPIVFFSSLHLFLGPEQTKASRLDGELPHDPFEWAKPANAHLWANPLFSYLGSIWFYNHFIHAKAPLSDLAPTLGVLVGEVLFGVILYDLAFFPVHYAMHHSPWGKVRKVHGYHHRSSSKALNALETVQHSYMDGFLQVAVNVIVQQISPFGGPKHAMSRLIHNIVVTYLLSEAHSGYDLPWMSHRVFPEVLGGSPRHEAHHHDGRVYYQQYFKYLDDFFGFTKDGKEQRKDVRATSEMITTVAASTIIIDVAGTGDAALSSRVQPHNSLGSQRGNNCDYGTTKT